MTRRSHAPSSANESAIAADGGRAPASPSGAGYRTPPAGANESATPTEDGPTPASPTNSKPPAGIGVSPHSEHVSAALAIDLSMRAQQMLAAENPAGYRELFGQLNSIADHHRRYWACVCLIERGLAASIDAPHARVGGLFADIAAGALQMLESEPSEPKLLNYAGVALYELWSLDAAQALFKAAKRLDPPLDQIDRNLAALAKRRRVMRAAGRAAPASAAVADLASRALQVARRAQPAQDMRLSLCMIVRDEQEMLPRCLASVADAVDEMVIVDTGSTDNTVEIARSFGAHVLFHEWTGSFAEARNVSFDAATGDWLLCLDADEVLVSEDSSLLRALTGRTWREAFYLAETNYTGDLDDGAAVTHNAMRVFRNRPEYRYEGRLHEQIAHCLPGYLPERLEATGVRIEHYGYLGVVRDSREKSRRNIELLRLQQAESPPSAFLYYNLGSEYAAAGDPVAALAELVRSWELLEDQPDRDSYEFAPALISRLVKALRACERPAEAIARAKQGLERFPGFTDLVLEQAFAAIALGERERAIELLQRCIDMGDAPQRYTATLGSGTYLPRIQLAELRRAAGEEETAIELLERCVREHPRFIGSVLPYASALLANGSEPEEVVRAIERHMPDLSPAARFMLATALYEGGATAAAEAQFREVLTRQPHSSRARVALGEALLAQRRYGEAADVASGLDSGDPLAVIARRSELFARIAGGDVEGVESALDSARAAGMPTCELDLFATWRELARSDEAPTIAPSTQTAPSPSRETVPSPSRETVPSPSGQATQQPRRQTTPPSSIQATPSSPGHATPPLPQQTLQCLSEEAVPALEVMLEALLRVHDFKVFEVLLGALDLTPLDPRERHELLAEMYLRRGFAASAAQEWMAVCEQEPDLRALLGLARVASTQGMSREAGEFAAAALACDPDNALAASLLSQAQSIAA
jgi:tetratricopeptide (TPR) repeat protein